MNTRGSGLFRIGTSGIVVPGTKETFPESFQNKSRLHYYGSIFNTIEINTSFYKLPMPATFEKWSLDVPQDFLFSIKLWKEITHIKKLNIDLSNIDIFFKAADNIGTKKGCLLIQFPGSITVEYSDRVEQILLRIAQLDPENKWQKAVEFRSLSWYTSETHDLLNRYKATIVLHDMPKSKNEVVNEAAKFIYYRFHGPTGNYRGSYSADFLQQHAQKIRDWLTEGKQVYVYFNNTMGSALENVMSLKAMVEK